MGQTGNGLTDGGQPITMPMPAEMFVDYVRVYRGPDTAERFEATFTDGATGWQQVSIPLTEFVRSDDQPAGAPDDGLGLDEVVVERSNGFSRRLARSVN